MSTINTITLDCGMPLLVEKIPGMRSVGLTWLLPAGTARDPEGKVGMSAMWAELLQRGAGTLNSRQQADAFDKLGASRSAGTESMFMNIGATLLGSRLDDALPLIVDMVLRPTMDPDGVEPTRDLCLQSIEALKDDPQERVMQLLRQHHAPAPINRSNLGEAEGLRAVQADELAEQWHARAKPVGSILAIAGDVDASKVASKLNQLLKGWSGSTPPVTWGRASKRGYVHEPDKTSQVHIAIAYDAPAESDPGSVPERLAGAVLSGGMSGRLFTEVREKRGLCYSVYASYASDAKFGRTVAYSGTTSERAQQTLDVLMGELKRILTPDGKVQPGELQRAVVGIKSKLIMSGESSSARAGALARDYHRIGRGRSLEELAAAYDAISVDQLNGYLESRKLGEMTIATIGPDALTPPAQ